MSINKPVDGSEITPSYTAYLAMNYKQLNELANKIVELIYQIEIDEKQKNTVELFHVGIVDAPITDFEPLVTDLAIINMSYQGRISW